MNHDSPDLWDDHDASPPDRKMVRLPVDRRLKALLDRVARAEGVQVGDLIERILFHSLDEPPSDPFRESTRSRLAIMAAEEGIVRFK